MSFPVHEVGIELFQIWDETGTRPWTAETQAELTPLQRRVFAKTKKWIAEKKRERMENAKSGNGGPGPGGAQPNSGYAQKKKSILENKHGGGSESYRNQDFDSDKSLQMDEDELLDDDALQHI